LTLPADLKDYKTLQFENIITSRLILQKFQKNSLHPLLPKAEIFEAGFPA